MGSITLNALCCCLVLFFIFLWLRTLVRDVIREIRQISVGRVGLNGRSLTTKIVQAGEEGSGQEECLKEQEQYKLWVQAEHQQ